MSAKDPVHPKLRQHFEDYLTRGEVLTAKELTRYAISNKLPVPPKPVLNKLKYEYKSSAIRQSLKPVKLFATAILDLPGNIDIDFADYLRKHKNANSGNVGFILAASRLTSQIATYPCKNKGADSYKKAIEHFVSSFSAGVWSITSDMESALSKSFCQELSDRFGISFRTIRTRSKASAGEVGVKTVKARLSLSLAARRELLEKKLGRPLTIAERNKSYRWIELLRSITVNINNQVIKGTTIKRGSVTPSDVVKVLEQKYKTRVPLNALSEGLRNYWPESFKDLFFRFSINDLVHLSRPSYYKEKNTFSKHTVTGAYHPIRFKIRERVVRTNKLGIIIPAYKIAYKSNGSELDGIFYEKDLTPSLYPDSDSSSSASEGAN